MQQGTHSSMIEVVLKKFRKMKLFKMMKDLTKTGIDKKELSTQKREEPRQIIKVLKCKLMIKHQLKQPRTIKK